MAIIMLKYNIELNDFSTNLNWVPTNLIDARLSYLKMKPSQSNAQGTIKPFDIWKYNNLIEIIYIRLLNTTHKKEIIIKLAFLSVTLNDLQSNLYIVAACTT